jgi:hypothetical protein
MPNKGLPWQVTIGHDRGGVLVAGIVENPRQEPGPFPRRAPPSFGEQEPPPLLPGQVSFQQGEDALLFMVEMTTKDLAELASGRRHADAAGECGVN